MSSDEDDEANEKLVAPPDWDGPVKDRGCTDILCLIMLIACWVGMTAVGAYAISNGDYRVILYPLDYDGNICGQDFNGVDMTEYPYLYYVNIYTGGVCVNQCPTLEGDKSVAIRTLITYSGVWQADGAELQNVSDVVQLSPYYRQNASSDLLDCDLVPCYPGGDPENSFQAPGVLGGFGFAYYLADTYELLWRCYTTIEADEQIANITGANDYSSVSTRATLDFLTTVYADIWNARKYIAGFGFGLSFVLSLIYIFILRLPFLLNTFVWVSIFSMIGMFAVAGYFTYTNADNWSIEEPKVVADDTILYTQIASYILFGIAGILLLLTICLRRQIQLAIGCVKEAGKAVNSMNIILLVPVLQAIGLLIFWAIWSLYAVHLASLGDVSTESYGVVSVRSYSYGDTEEMYAWYLLFCFFWTSGFIVAVGDMIVAMAIAKWYFTLNKLRVTSLTVISSITTVSFYHLGTCAFGSLIIAIIKMIRAIIAKLQEKASKMDNKLVNCILCCCQCCFCCLEKCMKFINKNAYIQTAIFGTSFLTSARKAFFLILRNAARIAAVSYVSAAVLVLGKILISSITTAVAYIFMVEYMEEELYGMLGPMALIFFISYLISDVFMDVFEIAILTILHCFVADEEMFGGRPRYAQGDLVRWIDKSGGRNDDD